VVLKGEQHSLGSNNYASSTDVNAVSVEVVLVDQSRTNHVLKRLKLKLIRVTLVVVKADTFLDKQTTHTIQNGTHTRNQATRSSSLYNMTLFRVFQQLFHSSRRHDDHCVSAIMSLPLKIPEMTIFFDLERERAAIKQKL